MSDDALATWCKVREGSRRSGQVSTFSRYSGAGLRCLDDLDFATASGALAGIWNCNGGPNQQWLLNADGSVTAPAAPGLCLGAPAGRTTDGALLGLQTCAPGAISQRWAMA